jgi:hypothetical protein
MSNIETSGQQIFSVSQFLQRHQYLTNGGLRHLIFHSDSNGFASVLRRIGRRVYISEPDYMVWLNASQSCKQSNSVKMGV